MSAIKTAWQRSKIFTILTVVQYIIALFFAFAAFYLSSVELKVATGSLAVAFASIASSDIGNMVDKEKIDQILDKLNKIEDLQKEIQSEQKEQANSGTPIVASLEAMSQYYMDFLTKQKTEAEDDDKS